MDELTTTIVTSPTKEDYNLAVIMDVAMFSCLSSRRS